MMAFPVVGSLVQSRGWRVAWFAVGAAILVGLVPLAMLLVRRNPESIGIAADGDARTRCRRRAFRVPSSEFRFERRTRNRNRNRNRNLGTRRLHPARSPSHTRVLDLRHRRCAVRPCRVGHRIVQRIDSRRARLRTRRLLPDARRHRDDRARWKFHRRVACALRPAESIDGDLARSC